MMSVWYIPEGIANIFSMNELEKNYWITYDSWERCYVVHTQDGPVRFYKDENGLLYINLEDSEENAAVLLIQTRSKQQPHLYKWCNRTTKGSPKKKFYKPRRQGAPWD
jgi:hypothetical protein